MTRNSLLGYMLRPLQYAALITSLALPATGRAEESASTDKTEAPTPTPEGGQQPLDERLLPEVPPPKSLCERYDCVNDIGALSALAIFGVSIGFHYQAREGQQELSQTCGRKGTCLESDIAAVESDYRVANYLAAGAGIIFTAVMVRGFYRNWGKPANNSYTVKPMASGIGVSF